MSTAFRGAGALPRVRSYSPADWITGPLTSQYVVGATLAVGSGTAVVVMLAVEISRGVRPFWGVILLMLWSAGIVIAAIDRVRLFHEQTLERVAACLAVHQRDLAALVDLPETLEIRTEVLARDLVGAVTRASQPVVAQIAGLRDEVDLLAERVEEATTAAAIIRRATGRPVHPVPDLPDDGS